MKQLMNGLQALFSTMTLVDDCRFGRGLQIRFRPTGNRQPV